MINEDVKLAKGPAELRNQRVYAVNVSLSPLCFILLTSDQAGINGLLDVSRVTYREAVEDAYKHMKELNGKLPL